SSDVCSSDLPGSLPPSRYVVVSGGSSGAAKYAGGVSGPVIGNGRGEDRPRPPAAGNRRTVGCLLVGGNTVVVGGMRVAGVVVVVGGRVIPGDVVIVGGVT